jgi:2-C-methyl-D-erythritol 4-phosphate cytidylyltransferase
MISALIVAGGRGLRMGSAQRKQYLNLLGRPILVRTLQVFDQCLHIQRILVVVPRSEIEYCEQNIITDAGLRNQVILVEGGQRRQDSVFNGLQFLGADEEGLVLIHDGVRPFVSAALIEACIKGAVQWGACIPAVMAVDTPKKIDSRGVITQTVPREQLHMAQTPQAFNLSLIQRAHRQARRLGRQATDDASLVEALGIAVHVIPGLRENIKITTPEDLVYAEALLNFRKEPHCSG